MKKGMHSLKLKALKKLAELCTVKVSFLLLSTYYLSFFTDVNWQHMMRITFCMQDQLLHERWQLFKANNSQLYYETKF